MRFPNWFRYGWWIFLLSILSCFIYSRIPDLTSGHATYADLLLLVLWLALALVPLFQEISLPGISLRQELRDIKQDIKHELLSVRSIIASSVDVRTLVYPSPPPDARLPELEVNIRSAVEKAMEKYGIKPEEQEKEEALPHVDEHTQFLMMARYSLEKEVRRIWGERISETESKRPFPFYKLVQDLVSTELIDPKLGHLLREVYSICSPAVHGEPVSDAKAKFVSDVIPEILSVLRAF